MPSIQNNNQLNDLRHDSLKNETRNYGQASKLFDRDIETIDLPEIKRGRSRNIINAISEIQRFHVIESKTELPKDYFALEQIIDYFKIGFFSGILESLLFAIIVSIFQAIYPSAKMYFLHQEINLFEQILFNIISYSTIIATTGFMLFLSKYYKGVFTKRAIFSLLNGRSFSFFAKGALFYFGFRMLYKYSKSNVETTANVLSFINETFVKYFYQIDNLTFVKYYYECILEKLLNLANELSLIMIATALIPYFTIFYKSFKERVKRYEIEEAYNKN